MKKILAMLLCVAMSIFAFGCKPPVDDPAADGKLKITIPYSSGGIGSEWITGPAQRYNDLYGDKPYGDYTGVYIDTPQAYPSPTTMLTEGYDIIAFDRQAIPSDLANLSYVIEIDDIVREPLEKRNGVDVSIHDKINPEFRKWFQNDEGKYVAVPYIEYYGGLAYDIELFERENLFIAGFYNWAPEVPNADPSAMDDEFIWDTKHVSDKFGMTLYLTSKDGVRSVGPNGVEGDYDDGLPSSLYELIALSDYFASNSKGSPFALSGQYLNYANMMLDGLYHSIAGNDNGYSIMSLDTEGRKVNVITGFTNDRLFPGISYLKKPIVQEVVITEATGYYTTWMEEKYYINALLEIIETEGWFTPGTAKETVSHIATQANFLFGGYSANSDQPATLFLMEGSFWNNESRVRGNYEDFYFDYEYVTDRRTAWLPLPVTIDVFVKGELVDISANTNIPGDYDKEMYEQGYAGHKPTLLDVTRSFMCINANIEDDPIKIQACKDFLKFLMTDVELSHFTVEAGVFKPMSYEMKQEDMDSAAWNSYLSSLWDIRQNCMCVYYEGDNETFYKSASLFQRGYASGAFGIGTELSYMTSLRHKGMDAMEAFQKQMYSRKTWESVYQGNASEVVYYNGVSSTLE